MPLPPETVAELQATVTADAGTVPHPEKDVPTACTVSVQLMLLLPPLTAQLTVAGLLPETLPRSGSVAVKVMVLGLAVIVPTAPAATKGGVIATARARRGCPPTPYANLAPHISAIATKGESRRIPQSQVALIVYVTVAEYEPVTYTGSLVSVQAVDPVLPAFVECALAPKVATAVAAVVLDVCDPPQAVPGAATVQVYARVSPPDGGDATEGPPEGLKSDVTCNWMLPVPPVCVVRTL